MAVTRRRFLRTMAAGLSGGVLAACRQSPTGLPGTMAPVPTTVAPAPTTTTTVPSSSTVATTPLPSLPPPTTAPVLDELLVIARHSWGLAGDGRFLEHLPERITIHHTAVLADDTSGHARARQHQRYHRSLGWPDLAYHHLVDRAGTIFEGRPLWARGDTATTYDPTGHYLPCLEGDFDRQQPSDAQMESLVKLVAAVADDRQLDPTSITGHGDHAATSCPGSGLVSKLGELQLAVSASLGRYRIRLVDGEEAASLLSRIQP